MQSGSQKQGEGLSSFKKNQLKINMTNARMRELVRMIGNTKKNMNYITKDLMKARSLHQSLRRETETISLLTNKSEYHASTSR